MSIRQQIIDKLWEHGIENISSNILETYLFNYKKVYNNKFKGIDLLFDMLDDEAEFFKFLNFINNQINESNIIKSDESTAVLRNCYE